MGETAAVGKPFLRDVIEDEWVSGYFFLCDCENFNLHWSNLTIS